MIQGRAAKIDRVEYCVSVRHLPTHLPVAIVAPTQTELTGQIELWKKTGAPPPNQELWDKIAKDDVFMKQLKKVSLDVPGKNHAAYYFEKWPAVHKAFSDAVIKAVTGKREDIGKALAEGAPLVSAAAK